ncbi:metal-dependent hydrolase [Roseibium alexandrii]|uniref:Inner membrane protein n=1 Tax=Roseibium alexandrii TaxID=388408 RepID=A0A0M7A1A8_9HYPH|nr:metal-dependent hydrolase [Roseibium alexandrii]CTQ68785.1 hypothetical protein LAX5112_01886 [Roseibium alexandrii]
MDSITQFVLGAAVSTACLGKKIGPRKAALVGGLLGTVPDLDVLIPFADPVDSFVYHRGWTHSVFVHALAAPVFGELLVRLFKGLRELRWLTYLTVYLCFATHAMIDAMTVYGTRIFWPFYPDPVGVGSVFIIDPVYSLPLLFVVIWAFFKRDWTQRFGRWVGGVLVATSAYMLLSVGIQSHVEQRAEQIFASQGQVPEKIFAIAAPFNIALWKVIGLDEDRYQNLYLSLFDGDQEPEIYTHSRHPELVACVQNSDAYQKLDWFSRGFNRAELVDGKVVISDLRMGLTPGYAFRFAVGEQTDGGIVPMMPERDLSLRRADSEDFAWLGERLRGRPAMRAAEASENAAGTQVAERSC